MPCGNKLTIAHIVYMSVQVKIGRLVGQWGKPSTTPLTGTNPDHPIRYVVPKMTEGQIRHVEACFQLLREVLGSPQHLWASWLAQAEFVFALVTTVTRIASQGIPDLVHQDVCEMEKMDCETQLGEPVEDRFSCNALR